MTADIDTTRSASVMPLRSRIVSPGRVATATIVVGLLLVADVLVPRDWRVHSLVTGVVPPAASVAARAVTLIGGWFLLRLARGLRHRKRVEWQLAVITCLAVLIASAAHHRFRPVTTSAVLIVLWMLVAGRREFTASADRHGRLFAVRVLAQGVVITYAYGVFLLLLPGRAPGTSFGARLGEVAASMVGLGGGLSLGSRYFADLFHATVLTSTLITLVLTVVAAFRSPSGPATLDASDDNRLRALLARQGSRDSLGYFALRRDKSAVWSDTGKSAVTFRVLDGVALVSGDPIGDPEAWPGAIGAFRELVSANGWVPAVMGCSETGATIFAREYGLRALALGDEAIVDCATFSLVGRDMRDVRHACTRMQRAGYDVVVRRIEDVPAGERLELADAAARWRGDEVERGFSMALSRFGDDVDPRCVVVTAERDGEVRGLLHFVPWGPDGLSLDLMRRDRSADNGLNEFMIAELVARSGELGVRRVSLNFAVFRDALERGKRVGAGPVLRWWRGVLLFASRWYQIDSLYRFNDKFSPIWEPRFFCYPRARDVPRLALAALEAEAFLVRPSWASRRSGRRG